MKKWRFTDHQIMAVLKEAEAGVVVPLMAHLKELEDENRRLKKKCAAAQLSAVR